MAPAGMATGTRGQCRTITTEVCSRQIGGLADSMARDLVSREESLRESRWDESSQQGGGAVCFTAKFTHTLFPHHSS